MATDNDCQHATAHDPAWRLQPGLNERILIETAQRAPRIYVVAIDSNV